MTRDKQKRFVQELSDTIADDICKQIDEGRIPDNWDGFELRWLLMYRHTLSGTMGRKQPRRKRAFNNTVLVNNL